MQKLSQSARYSKTALTEGW